jgi:hypothetical protein
MDKLPARHVHLDFHTSEHIPGVGAAFDKKQFQAALKLGHVNSINIFAKCHHSWSYYPTKIGMVHPTLRRNLLGEQIEACHEMGVRVPIYYTVGWSAADVRMHPEWAVRRKDGATAGAKLDAKPDDPKPLFDWTPLCPSGRYRELILAQTQEICDMFDVDGLWYDICYWGEPCYCENCRKGMKDQGLDADDPKQAWQYHAAKWQSFTDQTRKIVLGKFPQATTFYNGGASVYSPEYHAAQTIFELEDLPSSWGGYDKFPLRARFFEEYGRPIVAMSGKFHTNWGEFGGFKAPEAIRFEAACMIAYGANCCFGDQLHPAGRMDEQTYANIGHAYKYVEQIQQYGLDGQAATRLGVMLGGREGDNADDQGVANMLLETQLDFRVVTREADLAQFDTIILTGNVRMDKALAARFTDYLAGGGKLLALANSAMDAGGKRFMIDIGAKFVGPARFQQDYLVCGGTGVPPVSSSAYPARKGVEETHGQDAHATSLLAKGLPATPFLNYVAAVRVKPTSGKVLSAIREPFFDRTYGHYCGHQNTPYQLKDALHPGAVATDNVVYLAHPMGRIYHKHGAKVHRDYFINALRMIYKKPALEVRMPSAGRATLIHQPQHNRYVAHLLYGPPMQRGNCLVIEDLVPLRDVPVTIRVPQKITKAYTIPGKKAQKIRKSAGAIQTTIDEFACHTAVVFEY